MDGEGSSAGDRSKGVAAAGLGGLLLSLDVPLLKLADAETFTVIAVRGLLVFTSLFIFWSARRYFLGLRTPFINGYTSVAVAAATALASILFIQAIYLTSVANIVFILAFNPLFAAILGWVVLGERLDKVTVAAVATSIVGVGIIVFDGLNSGGFIGNIMALAVSLIIAVSITIIRRSRSDQSMSAANGGLLAAAMTVWFSHPATLGLESWGWLGLNGLLVMPTSAALLMYAPRYVSGPLVAMFYLLETVLTPVWMWLVFDEIPTLASLIGGVIVIISLVSHSLYMLAVDKKSSRPRTVAATRPLQIATTLRD